MMDLMLPGRDSESGDYEAQSALRTLLESEKIQGCDDEELYERILEQIDFNLDMLTRVASLIEGLGPDPDAEDEETEGETPLAENYGPERSDTRTIEDFLQRANRARKKENDLNEQPVKAGYFARRR